MASDLELIGAIVPLPSYVTGEGEPYRPVAILWVDAASHYIFQTLLARPDEALAEATASFGVLAAEHPPARVRVSDETLAAALREVRPDTAIVVAPTPELREIVAGLKAHMQRADEAEDTYLEGDMAPEDVGVMFAAAARLYRAAPWSALPTDVYLGVRCELLGVTEGALTVVGQMGTAYGFSLFGSMAAMTAFRRVVDAANRGEQPEIPPHIMFSFDTRDEVPRGRVREIMKHGWELAGHAAYPAPVVFAESGIRRGLTRTELFGVAAVMTVLAELLETHATLATAWEHERAAIEAARAVETPLGSGLVAIRAPLAVPLDAAIACAKTPGDDAQLELYANELLDVLTYTPGVSDVHLNCAEMMIVQSVNAFDTLFLQLTPAKLDRLLFFVIPETVAIPVTSAPHIIEAARHLMRLGADQGITAAKACVASLSAPALAEQLERALADEERYAPGKRIVMEGIREGYDIGTEAGLTAWLDELARRAAPSQKKPAKPKAAPKPKANKPRKPRKR